MRPNIKRDFRSGADTSAKILRKPWYMFWDFVTKFFFEGKPYTLQVPYGHRVFTPWFDIKNSSEFSEVLQIVNKSGESIVSPDRYYMLYQLARMSLNRDGDFAECGVYKGGSAHLISLLISKSEKYKLFHLFDTFSGMPETSIPSRDYHAPGDFSDTSLDAVKARLADFKSFCNFYPGLIPDTFRQIQNTQQFSFVHIDVDIFQSVLDCCKWFWPRMSSGGVIVFDDYGFYPYRRAAKAAVDEFFYSEPEEPISLPTGQALIIKL
jgi:O-methyltransferase